MNTVQSLDTDHQTPLRPPLNIICDYLNSQYVLTLCCYDTPSLWCASCFYTFEQNSMSFLIMSDIKSKHGRLMVQNNHVVGTVSEQNIDIFELRGIQFSGSIALLIGDKEDAVRHNFYDRFPVIKLIPSPIWRLTINEIKMTDHSVEFAHKYIWKRS